MNAHTRTFLDGRDFARIARAIRFIDEHFRSQPRLAAIAASAHLSEFHFNRLFRRWAGLTPRQYLAFVTARAARGALTGTASVLEAAYAVGLSGPGRLHDLMVTLEAVTPGELKGGGARVRLECGFSDTPFGRALIARTPRGIAHLSFVEPGRRRPRSRCSGNSGRRRVLSRSDAGAAALAAQIWGGSGRRGAAPDGGGHELPGQGLAGTDRDRQRRHDHVQPPGRGGGGGGGRPGGGQRRGGEPGGLAHSLS